MTVNLDLVQMTSRGVEIGMITRLIYHTPSPHILIEHFRDLERTTHLQNSRVCRSYKQIDCHSVIGEFQFTLEAVSFLQYECHIGFQTSKIQGNGSRHLNERLHILNQYQVLVAYYSLSSIVCKARQFHSCPYL
jgi:hypothetical protein